MAQWLIPTVIVLLGGSMAFLLFLKLGKRFQSGSTHRRRLDLMLVKLTQDLRRNPNNATAYTKRGIIRLKKKDTRGGLADLDKAIQIDEEQVEARYHRAITLQARGDLPGAEEDFVWIEENSEDPYYRTAVKNHLSTIRSGHR